MLTIHENSIKIRCIIKRKLKVEPYFGRVKLRKGKKRLTEDVQNSQLLITSIREFGMIFLIILNLFNKLSSFVKYSLILFSFKKIRIGIEYLT
jgi:hypothetical protein